MGWPGAPTGNASPLVGAEADCPACQLALLCGKAKCTKHNKCAPAPPPAFATVPDDTNLMNKLNKQPAPAPAPEAAAPEAAAPEAAAPEAAPVVVVVASPAKDAKDGGPVLALQDEEDDQVPSQQHLVAVPITSEEEDDDAKKKKKKKPARDARLRTSRLKVANACCELETRLVISVLEGLECVVEPPRFNLIGRVAIVRHAGSPEPILAALNAAHLGARLEDSAVDSAEDSENDASKKENNLSFSASCARIMTSTAFWTAAGGVMIVACAVVLDAQGTREPSARTRLSLEAVLGLISIMGAIRLSRRAFNTCRAAAALSSNKTTTCWSSYTGSCFLMRGVDMNALGALAIVGARLAGDAVESAAVAVVFAAAEEFEDACVRRAAKRLDAAEAEAFSRADHKASLKPGDRIDVRAGDRVPCDGVLIEGWLSLDESAATGESVPVSRAKGDLVFCDTIAVDGWAKLRVGGEAAARDKSFSDSSSSVSAKNQQPRLTQDALLQQYSRDARASTTAARGDASPTFASRFAARFAPVAILAALLVFLVPVFCLGLDPRAWARRALALCVAACPCAFALAEPAPYAAGVAAAARRGVVVKRADVFDALGAFAMMSRSPRDDDVVVDDDDAARGEKAKERRKKKKKKKKNPSTSSALTDVALDKTGTLTLGRCRVARTRPLRRRRQEKRQKTLEKTTQEDLSDEEDLLEGESESVAEALSLAAAVEAKSAHPVAAAIVAHVVGHASEANAPRHRVAHFRVTEAGVRAVVDGRKVEIAAARRFAEKASSNTEDCVVDLGDADDVVIAVDDRPVVALAVRDELRPEAAAAVERLAWNRRVSVLTGDKTAAARDVARDLDDELAVLRRRGRETTTTGCFESSQASNTTAFPLRLTQRSTTRRERRERRRGGTSRGSVRYARVGSLSDDDDDDDVADAENPGGNADNITLLTELTPRQKLNWVLEAQAAGRRVLFVGDGMNDAAALEAATVGVAMGAAGAYAAVAAADLVVTVDDLTAIADVEDLARLVRRVVVQNLGLAVAVKLVFVVLLFAHPRLGLWLAIVADLVSLLFVLANGLRPLAFFDQASSDSSSSPEAEFRKQPLSAASSSVSSSARRKATSLLDLARSVSAKTTKRFGMPTKMRRGRSSWDRLPTTPFGSAPLVDGALSDDEYDDVGGDKKEEDGMGIELC